MKVLVVIFLIILITSYCVCVDDEKRLPVDFDEHQVQLDGMETDEDDTVQSCTCWRKWNPRRIGDRLV
jgi:sugar lactone lactonase YvrE